jgi:ectoine hydroxylase-related dioxygenase (phytanoyl-CoA dioxygenase family)
MHHERTIHGSMPNPSDRRRVGISFFYMPAHVRSTIGRRTATLVRGTDKYGHWDPEPMPKTDLDPVCMEFLRQSWSRYRDPDMPQAAKLKAS